jgi:acetyl-CoA C-acetyltransferase
MSVDGKAYIVGAYELPYRSAPDKTVPQMHAEAALGALRDAGLEARDIDGYFCGGDAPGALQMIEYLGLQPRYFEGTEAGGASYTIAVGHAAQAIALGKCKVALVTLAGRPRSDGVATGTTPRIYNAASPDVQFEAPFGATIVNWYAQTACRHFYEFGTTAEQLAWIKVAASHHAQHNPLALLRDVVSVADVLASPVIADPLHRLDCCVITDGGGALIVAAPEIARSLARPRVKVRASAEAVQHSLGGKNQLVSSATAKSGPAAFAEVGLNPKDIDYASIYDCFTIAVLIQLEDLGFCAKGEGGRFVSDGNLISGQGRLPFNTDGGGLCSNHPANRGGMTKTIEAVRQLRGEAQAAVQVANCRLALVNALGGSAMSNRHCAATLILERE